MATKRIRPVEILTPVEVEALIGASSRRAPSGVRNRAMVAVMYFAGLRVAELCALQVRDVDLEGGAVNVRHGKGARQRVAALNSSAVAHLEPWLRVRKGLAVPKGSPLFCGISAHALGAPVSQRYVRAMLSRLAGRAGIDKRVHPHGLRHSHAHRLASSGVPANVIQAQLGHGSLATTGVYLSEIAPTGRVEQINSLDW